MSELPEIRFRGSGEGTLAGDFVAGREPARALFPARALEGPGLPDGGRPVRLETDAFGTSTAEAAGKLERILAGEGTLVTTGQQPVLFLGPLYVLYKALSALELARHVEAETGRPALAVFWIASDDHDWEEVGTTHLLDLENRLREIRLIPPPEWEERPVGPAPLGDPVRSLLDDVIELLPDTEFVDSYLKLFRGAYAPDATVAGAFERALGGVLGEAEPGFAWLDAASPAVKGASAEFLARGIREAGPLENALERGTRRVREAGYEPRIPVLPGGSGVFFDTGTARRRIYRTGEGRASLGSGGETREVEALLDRLREAPERFSPNVFLRPVLESWLLPVGATVLGPGELAYWAQLPGLFERLDVPMPWIRPRHGWTLVEGKVRKVLEKLDVEPEALEAGEEAVIRKEVEESRPAPVEEALGALRAALGEGVGRVESAVDAHLPGIRSAVGKTKSEVFGAVSELERRIDARVRERREVLIRQIRKCGVHLYPDGVPQERRISPLYYLARYGPSLVEALAERTREATPGGFVAEARERR